MAGRGIKLFKVLGIQISLDFSWFIVFALFAWSLSYGYFPFRYPGLATATYIVMGIVSALLLFVCVLIHELSHSVTANRLGLDIKEITLFIFGGVARLTKEPDDAKKELKIAIAGPIASAVLAVAFGVFAAIVRNTPYQALYAILAYLSLINIVLLVFNMIPGFPLDGGRVLRALWWAKTGDLDKSTRVASSIGKGFAMLLMFLGLFQILKGNFIGGIWAIFIGFFVQQAAESGYQQVVMKRLLEGLKVKDVMSGGVIAVPEDATLSEAVDKYFLKHHFVSYPVLSDGRLAGLLLLNNVRAVERERWDTTLVRDVMERLGPDDVLHEDDDASTALGKMIGGAGRFPVLNGNRLVGIVSRRDIMKMMEFKSGLRR